MWQIEIHRGPADQFHAMDPSAVVEPTVWWFGVQSSALVLGSSQPLADIDVETCSSTGIDVVRRRSGGGAVLLQPGDALWVDVVLPVTDHRWTADVGRSAWWLGEAWQSALAVLGVDGTSVHRDAMVRTEWSDRVCFAGFGGGEVVRDGRKVVGISQRRTRAVARFQCALYHHWRPDAHVPLFNAPGPSVADLADAVFAVDAEPAAVMAAFAAALDHTN